MYISDRTNSTPQRLPNMCLTQPLPALSDSQVVGVVCVLYVYYRQRRKRLSETHVWKMQRDAVRSITNLNSLGSTYISTVPVSGLFGSAPAPCLQVEINKKKVQRHYVLAYKNTSTFVSVLKFGFVSVQTL